MLAMCYSPPTRCREQLLVWASVFASVPAGSAAYVHSLPSSPTHGRTHAIGAANDLPPICSNFSMGNICCSLNGKLSQDTTARSTHVPSTGSTLVKGSTRYICVCNAPWFGENCERMAFKAHNGEFTYLACFLGGFLCKY